MAMSFGFAPPVHSSQVEFASGGFLKSFTPVANVQAGTSVFAMFGQAVGLGLVTPQGTLNSLSPNQQANKMAISTVGPGGVAIQSSTLIPPDPLQIAVYNPSATNTLAYGAVVYVDGSGNAQIADYGTLPNAQAMIGLVSSASGITPQGYGFVRFSGLLANLSGLTPGLSYFMGAAGAIIPHNSPSIPSPGSGKVILRVGIARDSQTLLIYFGIPMVA